mmetsp:Transcript_2475/g.5232  ORF Transcript_2475/g.5232 Transcript_2475/m.5232 type:complete len:94 (+) Transcript_2475:1321-1602(+)
MAGESTTRSMQLDDGKDDDKSEDDGSEGRDDDDESEGKDEDAAGAIRSDALADNVLGIVPDDDGGGMFHPRKMAPYLLFSSESGPLLSSSDDD